MLALRLNWSGIPWKTATDFRPASPREAKTPAFPLDRQGTLSVIAKPEMLYPEAITVESTRPSGSGDLRGNPTRHTFSDFAVELA
jgi:hypothetical protein